MEKPYKIRKNLVDLGNSVGLIIPKFWISNMEKRLNKKKILFVDVEIYKDKLVITAGN